MEKTGVVSYEEILEIGTVGMSARMNTLNMDIRSSHPHNLYKKIDHKPIIKHHGDVYSRVQIRKEEVKQSMAYITDLIREVPEFENRDEIELTPQKDKFSISLVEGWHGEICHCAITGSKGELMHYKIKDPSFHNWLALALSVRNNEISDFPICNKSFNLSYSGQVL